MKALIALEDGRVFEGVSLGVEGETAGEVVFNTSMTGYQEIMTDPWLLSAPASPFWLIAVEA